MNITVIGNGRWGTFITWYLDRIGHKVALYGRSKSESMKSLIENRRNQYISFNDSVLLTTNLEVINESEVIVISINAQGLTALIKELNTL